MLLGGLAQDGLFVDWLFEGTLFGQLRHVVVFLVDDVDLLLC